MVPAVLRRRQLRLRDYDYSSGGLYFVTICTQERALLLANEAVKQMVQTAWVRLADKYAMVQLDEYIIMPNHLHGIIVIVEADGAPCANLSGSRGRPACLPGNEGEHMGSPSSIRAGRAMV